MSNPTRHKNPATEFLRQIYQNTWLVGNMLIHRNGNESSVHEAKDYTWIDMDGSKYRLQKIAADLQSARESKDLDPAEEVNSPHIKLTYDAGMSGAVWAIGSDVICKVHKISAPQITSEVEILDFVQSQHPSFRTPEVISYTCDASRSYLFIRRLHGRTLDDVWGTLNHYRREHYANKVVEIFGEMATWKDIDNRIGGIDRRLNDEWLSLVEDFTDTASLSAKMHHNCIRIRMDCTDLVFQHCDLGPTNILVEKEPHNGTVGVIDFELAGYFPKDWIGTKCRICYGMNLNYPEQPDSEEAMDWRRFLGRGLRSSKYRDSGTEYIEISQAGE